MSDKNISSSGTPFASWQQLNATVNNNVNTVAQNDSDIVIIGSDLSGVNEKSDKIEKDIGNWQQLQNKVALTIYNTLSSELGDDKAKDTWREIFNLAPPVQGGHQYVTLADFSYLNQAVDIAPSIYPSYFNQQPGHQESIALPDGTFVSNYVPSSGALQPFPHYDIPTLGHTIANIAAEDLLVPGGLEDLLVPGGLEDLLVPGVLADLPPPLADNDAVADSVAGDDAVAGADADADPVAGNDAVAGDDAAL